MWSDARIIQTIINDLSTEQRIDDESDSDDEFYVNNTSIIRSYCNLMLPYILVNSLVN